VPTAVVPRRQRKALRLASSRDVTQSQELRTQDEVARRKATERVKAHGLVMKLSDAEWQWDRKKLTFYFTAEKRVDFRNLVRDLAALFPRAIELKQIGVRDEAKRLDGVGRCGRQYCSAGWLPELRPVNLGVAKDQRLSAQPSQISGGVWSAHVLPTVRARVLRAKPETIPQRRQDRRDRSWGRKGRGQRHLQRARDAADGGRRDAGRAACGIAARNSRRPAVPSGQHGRYRRHEHAG